MLMEDIQARKEEIALELASAELTEERAAELKAEAQKLAEEAARIKEAAEAQKALEQEVLNTNDGDPVVEDSKGMNNMENIDYRSAWLKSLQGKDLTVEERTAVTASAAIPTETMDKIVGILEGSPLFAAVDVTYIPGNVTYPAESTVNDAAWVAMGTAATDAADTLAPVSLAAYKLIKTVEITADVAGMAIDAFEDWLVERLANKILKAANAGILTGTGSSQATGIITTKSTADGTFTKAAMKYVDICAILADLPTVYHPNATFVMPRTVFFGEVLGMVDSTGNRVVVADAQSPAKFNILGYPVIVDDGCTVSNADNVLFGDLKYYKFNFAKAPEVTADDSVAFRTGSRVYRAMALADGKLADANAVVRYLRSTT